MKHYYFSVIFVLASLLPAKAQEPLPHNLTEAEKSLLPQFSFRRSALTLPPESPVRAAAEWEEVEYLVVTWVPAYQNILRQIVAAGVNECKVVITTQNQASVANYLTSNGISLTNVMFMNAPSDSIWIRDYAGNTIYSNDVGERALTDWIYNRPRPNDDAMPSAHATLTGIPIYITNSGTNDLVNTGGNYMSDGMGNAFASELILDENAAGNPYNVSVKTEEQIDAIMHDYMGIDNFIKMPTLPYDQIHHIDMHMKLLDEETLLVSKYPTGVADGPQIEANIAEIVANVMSPFGTPYIVKYIDAPPSVGGLYPNNGGAYRTFSNATFVNKTILIPTYRPEVDAPAIAKFNEYLPGYTVVGIDVDNAGENLISSLGAIHCITHTIGVAEPLWIVHQPVRQSVPGNTVAINAMIKHISGIASAKIFWREQGSTEWNETSMSFVAESNWTANLSMPLNGNDVEYYIWAQANSGKTLTRPIVAPTGFWTIVTQSLSLTEWAEAHISAPYPNPVRDIVNFNFDRVVGPISVSITNLLGQRLYDNEIPDGNGTVSLTLNDSWNGTLLVTFGGSFGKVTRKIVKL